MSLNIKDPAAHTLAQALAKETGETMTRAVTAAIRERLERVRRQRRPEATVAELLAIGHRCASTLQGQPVDHGDMLYDERGLPK
ncbi:type II toxin-antitoxin system VapB family antitoxin [Candidatus Binatia bacterium]|nr:type II toxin-antitoxin system VapB family antitoxin [Candidatus Binatia bacterium]